MSAEGHLGAGFPVAVPAADDCRGLLSSAWDRQQGYQGVRSGHGVEGFGLV